MEEGWGDVSDIAVWIKPEDTVVPCEYKCGALLAPKSESEIYKAYIHWRYHSYLGGCSHAC
jgi:hypothetical protein